MADFRHAAPHVSLPLPCRGRMKQNAPRTGHNPLRTPLLCCDHGRRLRRYATLLALPALAACGYNDSRRAHKGQLEVIGMTSEDLQACAGIPDKTARLDDHVQIFQYTRSINVPSTNDSTCSRCKRWSIWRRPPWVVRARPALPRSVSLMGVSVTCTIAATMTA